MNYLCVNFINRGTKHDIPNNTIATIRYFYVMIVGVAIRNKIGEMITLPRPFRHSDCIKVLKSINVNATKEGFGIGNNNQGFVTDQGVYLNRTEAKQYVEEIQQTLIRPVDESELFSESLW